MQAPKAPAPSSPPATSREAGAGRGQSNNRLDNRASSGRQREFQEGIVSSPRMLAQQGLQEAINNSPRMVAQRQRAEEISNSPRMVAQRQRAEASAPRPNTTGLPDQLKAGVESLSGYSLDDVQVHYNSSKPAQLQAHAYAQGSEIHVAPGQEEHLAHEAWHVVQQKQGRVRATMQLKGVGVNDDSALEQEADVMGVRAMGARDSLYTTAPSGMNAMNTLSINQVYQLAIKLDVKPNINDDGEFNRLTSGQREKSRLLEKIKDIPKKSATEEDIMKKKEYEGEIKEIGKEEENISNQLKELSDKAIDWVKYAEYIEDDMAGLTEEKEAGDEREKAEIIAYNTFLNDVKEKAEESITLGNKTTAELDKKLAANKKLPNRTSEEAEERNGLVQILIKCTQNLKSIYHSLSTEISAGKGGFSAVGRARDTDTSVTIGDKSDQRDDKFRKANHFLGNANLDGHSLLGNRRAYKKDDDKTTPNAANSAPVKIGGKSYQEGEQGKALAEFESFGLAAPEPSDATVTSDGKANFKKKDRGLGQLNAMENTNAQGLAWATKQPHWNTHPWEWLHIRAASLSGKTTASNLVLGTKDSNTHMMPFEANMRALELIMKQHPKIYSKLQVSWGIGNSVGGSKHVIDSITISWELIPTDESKMQQHTGTAEFKPLSNQLVLSKLEVRAIQDALKENNDALLTPANTTPLESPAKAKSDSLLDDLFSPSINSVMTPPRSNKENSSSLNSSPLTSSPLSSKEQNKANSKDESLNSSPSHNLLPRHIVFDDSEDEKKEITASENTQSRVVDANKTEPRRRRNSMELLIAENKKREEEEKKKESAHSD